MRVKPVLVLEPQWQLGDDRFGVRDGIDRDTVALEDFHDGFGHSVGIIGIGLAKSEIERGGSVLFRREISSKKLIALLSEVERFKRQAVQFGG